MPVDWEQVEPQEDSFDFSIPGPLDRGSTATESSSGAVVVWKLEESLLGIRSRLGQVGYEAVPKSDGSRQRATGNSLNIRNG
jgi:hypothetical protein